MQLITEEYLKLNQQKHAESKKYGTSGVYYVDDVIRLIKSIKSQDILDYGCGKSTLANNLPFTINQYDPAIKKHSALPEPADIVICTDVLEHIEPEFIDNVMAHIASLTKRLAYLSACTIEAKKTLSDGRNAHLLIKDKDWWIAKVLEYFAIDQAIEVNSNIIFIVKPKPISQVFMPSETMEKQGEVVNA